MAQTAGVLGRLDFGEPSEASPGLAHTSPGAGVCRLRLAPRPRIMTGPETYRILDLKRRRAQIRARRVLGLLG